MSRRIDIWTRTLVALMLALVVVAPIAGPICEAKAASNARADCTTACAKAGFMPLNCVSEMAEDGSCGNMTPAPERHDSERLVSTAPAPAFACVALTESTPVLGDGSDLAAPLRASAVERPPLDPLGARIRI